MISHGSMPSSRSGTRSRWTSMPALARAISESDEASPAAPQSCSDSTSPRSTRSSDTSISFLPRERVADLHRRPLLGGALPSSWLASTDAPPIPSRPGGRAVEDEQVAGPGRLRLSTPLGREQADAHRVDEAVRGVGGVEDGLAADVRHADAVAVVADRRRRRGRSASRARRSGARRAARSGGRPSRPRRAGSRRPRSRRPGTARPRDGWLCDSTLNATATPSPRSITPAFSPGPCSTRSPCDGSRFSSSAECL